MTSRLVSVTPVSSVALAGRGSGLLAPCVYGTIDVAACPNIARYASR